MRRRGSHDAERGAVLVIMALCVTFLCVIVAFAVDLGQGRLSRRDNQQTVDLASLSAGYYLAGNGDPADPKNQPRAACEAAFASVLTNAEGFATSVTAETFCSALPVSNEGCAPSTATITAGPLEHGGYTLRIEWPVPDSAIADARFDGDGLFDGDPCNRLAIHLHKVDRTGFARVIGVDSVESSARAVVAGAPGLNSTGVAALLLLEREGCGALQASGLGSIVVETVVEPTTGAERPGVIAADSAGSTTNFGSTLTCTSNQNAGGYVIFGNQPSGGDKIIAKSTAGGTPGIIATYAQTVGGRAACCHPNGLNVEPTGSSGITSRTPADTRFNPASRPAITSLHTSAWEASVATGNTIAGTPVTDCEPADGALFTPSAGEVAITVNCPGGFKVKNNRVVTFSGAAAVKFIGGIDVSGGGSLEVEDATTVTLARQNVDSKAQLLVSGAASFNSVRNLYIGGTPSTCTSDNDQCHAVSVSGRLRVNTGGLTVTSCADGPGNGGSATNWTAFATLGGTVDVSGGVSLCQTTVYVGSSQASYAAKQRISGGLNCSATSPCPLVSTANSRDRFSLSGGSGSSIIWSAPNQIVTPPTTADPFEGLALWVEGTGLSQIKGSGTLLTTGVFFAPNALFEFAGTGNSANPYNAQFFARTLNMSGQGSLYLEPNPRDAIPTAIPGTYAIIR